jgi:hypothetical protein
LTWKPNPANSESDDPTQRAYFFVPNNPPETCKPGEPLTFTNIDVYRLRDGDTFDLARWTTNDGFKYTIAAREGKLETKGNDGYIY